MKIPKPQNTSVFLVIVSVVTGLTVYFATTAIVSIQSWISRNAQPHQVSLTSTATASAKLTSAVTKQPSYSSTNVPTAINIPKINKNLPIRSAHINGNTWDLFGDAVAWLSTSALPGQGNVILYAHDWRTLWRDLYLLKPGDAVEIQYQNTWKRYVVSQSRDVDQHDVQAVLSNNNQLTMYTCAGTFDQKRRVVYATPAP